PSSRTAPRRTRLRCRSRGSRRAAPRADRSRGSGCRRAAARRRTAARARPAEASLCSLGPRGWRGSRRSHSSRAGRWTAGTHAACRILYRTALRVACRRIGYAFGVEKVATRARSIPRRGFTPELLRSLHTLANRLLSEDAEHFRVHAETNDVVHVYERVDTGEPVGFQFWRTAPMELPGCRAVLGRSEERRVGKEC